MAQNQKSGRVTIKEVAEDAGVSVAAVSKVLREAYGVSEALKTKVRASMKKLNYRPLATARGMRGQTFTIGVTFPDLRNPFFADILAGINSALERTQYQLMLGVSLSTPLIEETLIDSMIDRQMDGLILVGTTVNPAFLEPTASRKPLVTIGHHVEGESSFDTVNNDDRLGAILVVRHLVANGYRKIAMLSLNSTTSTLITEREHGYRQAMGDHGLQEHVQILRVGQTLREVQTATRRLLQSPDKPDALFCWTDFIALEVISIATELGLAIPDDLAVVGYDNTMYCDFAQNNLTSVDQSGEVLGLQSARLLIERIRGRQEAEHFVVTPRVVARGSSLAVGGRGMGQGS
ncbi:LacI family transcriptional regulator [Youhaiella tibetensis]|uniref:LacI family transcriptional regulator n=1 Tax=Paradevosia tibetensis TaxID=1447062 RepID=A0A5B9DNL8_9HYPH|nr:LacI family DNA-binding transcriptional regulator [Youhaiella tibetensis]QEE20582.1 LacI family transcriptional regulator [Youhaiella tibetensis]GGF22833.1 LacI family transcriptional regulator [Youhaiella tibetensis]